jgi:ABC-type uncharacterized transport system substrate-binding protein
MKRNIFGVAFCAMLLALYSSAEAQSTKPLHVGVIYLGGVFAAVVDGLRTGMKEGGWQEGKQYVLDIEDLKGDVKNIESVAQKLEAKKVSVIFTSTQPATTGAMKGTKSTPIVFAIGTDPVSQGFVQSFAKPGGRLTGIQYLARDLTGKRLELLKEILPKLRSVVTFYNPAITASNEGAKLGRDEAQRRNIKFVERHIKSPDDINAALDALKPGEFDAYFYVADAIVASQAQRIIDVARAKKLPTMFHDQGLVESGALASYGQSYFEIGRRSATYVQRVLMGTSPQDLRVETMEDCDLVFNLQTAKQIGVKIPSQVLARAKKVIK